jgi:16S rRNA (uracil1498-N3)-methyltransferase
MTRRRWIADAWTATHATLKGDQAHHLARVLRAKPGMVCDVVAGGFVYRAQVTAIDADQVQFELLEEVLVRTALPLTLVLSIFKFDRMEWAIEKATELGAAEIIPTISHRTEKHLAQAASKRVERWRRIAREAAQQSRRGDIPEITEPESTTSVCSFPAAESELRLLLAESGGERSLLNELELARKSDAKISRVRLAVGPEGGWTREEELMFEKSGWRAVGLGERILRAETAAIVAIGICSAALESIPSE